jgi:hypothetical protein
MFCVTCNYGTHQWVIGRAAALEWLAACGPRATVRNIWGRTVAARNQEEK